MLTPTKRTLRKGNKRVKPLGREQKGRQGKGSRRGRIVQPEPILSDLEAISSLNAIADDLLKMWASVSKYRDQLLRRCIR